MLQLLALPPPAMLIAIIVDLAHAVVIVTVRIDAYAGAERPQIDAHLRRRRHSGQNDQTGQTEGPRGLPVPRLEALGTLSRLLAI